MSCVIEGPYTKYSQILLTGQKIYTVTRKSCCCERCCSTITTDDFIALKLVPIISRLPINITFSKFPLGCYSPNIEIFSSTSAFFISVVPESDHLKAFKTRMVYLSPIVPDSIGLGCGPRNSISTKFPGDALSYWSRNSSPHAVFWKALYYFMFMGGEIVPIYFPFYHQCVVYIWHKKKYLLNKKWRLSLILFRVKTLMQHCKFSSSPSRITLAKKPQKIIK